MVQTQARVIQKETIAPAWWRLTLAAPELPPLLPGQFLLLRCADRLTCYLRRPIFPTPLPPRSIQPPAAARPRP
ncbi:MAG: hypothetical protein HC875_33505, partial [Anaerolineales bacterium]|nr:hypothetical protein [Anaerolineales bacterium]